MSIERGKFKQLVTENTLLGCQFFIRLPGADIAAIASPVTPSILKQCPCPMSNGAVEIKLDRTKRVLAAEMGITSETLSRTLAKFRDQKIVRVSGRSIVITQPRKLEVLLRKHLGEV